MVQPPGIQIIWGELASLSNGTHACGIIKQVSTLACPLKVPWSMTTIKSINSCDAYQLNLMSIKVVSCHSMYNYKTDVTFHLKLNEKQFNEYNFFVFVFCRDYNSEISVQSQIWWVTNGYLPCRCHKYWKLQLSTYNNDRKNIALIFESLHNNTMKGKYLDIHKVDIQEGYLS